MKNAIKNNKDLKLKILLQIPKLLGFIFAFTYFFLFLYFSVSPKESLLLKLLILILIFTELGTAGYWDVKSREIIKTRKISPMIWYVIAMQIISPIGLVFFLKILICDMWKDIISWLETPLDKEEEEK